MKDFDTFMVKQHAINKCVLDMLKSIDEELDIDSDFFGEGNVTKLERLILEQREVLY